MDASYRSTEVLIWNCHNQHGNQVTFLKWDASHKRGLSNSSNQFICNLALEISIRSDVSSDIEEMRICVNNFHQPIKVIDESKCDKNDSVRWR